MIVHTDNCEVDHCVCERNYFWSEIAELTHETQVSTFGWCSCEEQEQFPYSDCPNVKELNGEKE